MKAVTQPVIISNHGKCTHALISYERFVEQSTVAGKLPATDLLGGSAVALFGEHRDCILIIDDETHIVSINRAACDFMRISAETVTGRLLLDAFPMLENSYVYRNMVRTLRSGERYSGDAPSLLRDGAWLRLDILPVPVGAALIFRDITEEINAFHLADAKQAIVRAMEVDGSIGYARLSLREAIERADSVLIDMLGVTEEAIMRVKFSALMPQSRRAAFAQALEAVLHNEGARRIESELVGRDGIGIAVNLSIVDLHGAFAPEGAIVVITRR